MKKSKIRPRDIVRVDGRQYEVVSTVVLKDTQTGHLSHNIHEDQLELVMPPVPGDHIGISIWQYFNPRRYSLEEIKSNFEVWREFDIPTDAGNTLCWNCSAPHGHQIVPDTSGWLKIQVCLSCDKVNVRNVREPMGGGPYVDQVTVYKQIGGY